MAKKLAIILGIVFLIIGILGFVQNPVVGEEGLFATNTVHDLIHIVTGLIFILVAFLNTAKVSITLKVFAIIYLVIAILGFFSIDPGTGMGTLLGGIHINTADNWLHVVLSILIFAAGVLAAGKGDEQIPSQGSNPPENPPLV